NTSTNPTVLALVDPKYQVINNTFVLGANDGQLVGQVGGGVAPAGNSSSTNLSFLIDQQGMGNILQLQTNEQNRFLVASTGSVSILAVATSSTENILTVTNASNTLFTINSVGDAQFTGHIIVGGDTAGTATIKAGDNQTTVTFNRPYNTVPKIVVTVNGVPDFGYGVINKTVNGFTIATNKSLTEDTSFDWIVVEQNGNGINSQSGQNLSVISSPSGNQ